ncbi:hypothetical protein BHE74_00022159 [Ensete ventricosum]|nr:hypothetical protein BHE74_00022159 [Ensete ventricosum]
MASSPSYTTSGLSSAPSSPIPLLWAEECRPSGSLRDQSSPPSSSSGVMTQADVKALQALKVMKSYHDFDSTGQGGYYLIAWEGFKVEGAPSDNKGWKTHFQFVSMCRDWGFGVECSAHPISNVPRNLSDEESILVGQLKGILSASRAIRNLTEDWLVEAGLSPTSHVTH